MTALQERAAVLRQAPAYTLRALRFQRRRRGLAKRYLRGEGLEIGALHAPLQVPRHATVRYVDRMDAAGLRTHYPELAGEDLVEVDVIDDGETLASQPDATADFIIANHFIEHTQDPLGTIANLMRVLRPGGILYLAVPDRRRTFDSARPPTPLEHVARDHSEGPAWSRSSHFEEWARFVEHTPAEHVRARAQALEAQNYSIHFHVWSRPEFERLLQHASFQQSFSIDKLQENGHEFIAILRRT